MFRLFSRSKPTSQSARKYRSAFPSRSELLEARMMLAGDVVQNLSNPQDVNNDGHVTARDAAMISWVLGNSRSRALAIDPGSGEPTSTTQTSEQPSIFLDVNGDGLLDSSDLDSIVSALNGGSGEPGDVVTFQLTTTDLEGNPITAVDVGDEFILQVTVQDTQTDPDLDLGVFSPYLDIEFDGSLSSVAGELEFSSTYNNARQGSTATAGLIDEAGAIASSFTPIGGDEFELFSIRMQADAAGSLTFSSNPADDGLVTEVTVYSSDDPVDPGDILYDTATLEIRGDIQPPTGDVDLVAFAKAIAAEGVELWTSTLDARARTAQQLDLFGEGQHFLPINELFEKDSADPTSLVATQAAQDEGRTSLNEWVFPDGTSTRDLLTLEQIAERLDIELPTTTTPSIVPIEDVTVLEGSPLHIPLDGYDPDGEALTYTITIEDDSIVEPTLLEGNRSVIFEVEEEGGYLGELKFELFEQRAPRVAGRMIELAETDFYEGITFHRIANEFVIQGGDPEGTGRGGSDLGQFDDQFHVDLQHNRTGLLSMAKTDDDTNNSQFFVTENTSRHLDFNHSIFGVLVEGERVRETISNVDTQASSQSSPLIPVSISSATVINDTEDAVLMLRGLGTGGTTTVTITAEDADGNTTTETFSVTLAPDDVDNNNSPPFLDDFEDQVFEPGTPAEFQVTAQDVEGDPINFEAFINSDTVNIEIDETGKVTVDEFAGTLDALIRVSPQDSNGPFDMQFFTITIATDGPTAVDLLAATDSGVSSEDNVTNNSQLQFEVTGIVNNATVVLLNNGTEFVRETAGDVDTLTISTAALADLGSGTYEITAAFEVDGELSQQTPAISVTLDLDAPAAISNTVPTTAEVGTDYIVDVNHEEEGADGIRYSLVNAPARMEIDEVTGEITWLPTGEQRGLQEFEIIVTDDAGNATSNAVSIDVSGGVAALRMIAVDTDGNEIASIGEGSDFEIRVFIEDQRSTPTGVGQAIVSFTFDETLAMVQTGLNVGADFSTDASTGTLAGGSLQDVGGSASTALGAGEFLLAEIPLLASSAGTFVFTPVSSDAGVTLFDQTTPLTSFDFDAQPLMIEIFEVAEELQANNDSVEVDENSAPTTLEVLTNDTLSANSGVVEIISVTTPSEGGTATISEDGLTVSYAPPAGFIGEEQFTYIIRDSAGISSSADVSVTINNVNDPPIAEDRFFPDEWDANDANRTNFFEDSGPAFMTLPTAASTGNDEDGAIIGQLIADNAQLSIADPIGLVASYTPDPNVSGIQTFTYTLIDLDGVESEPATVTINIPRVNDAPITEPDVYENVEQGRPFTISPPDFLGNDSPGPLEDDQLLRVVSIGRNPTQGTVELLDDGSIVYTPDADATGSDTITYVIEDNGVSDIPGTLQEVSRPLQAIGEITFNIVDANEGPSAFDDILTVVAGTTRSIAVLNNDIDNDSSGNLALAQFSQGDQGGTVTQNGDELVYTPATGFVGTETITYTVSDGDLTDTGVVTVTVSGDTGVTNSSFRGSVFFDGNNDGQMGSGDQGIGGVVINLTGTDIAGNAVERQTTTAIDGSYAFETLPMGTFEITQEQPRFLLDGLDVADASSTSSGDDSFTITVGEEEIQSNANMFAERGLSLQFAALDAMSSRRGSGFLTAVSNGESQFIRNPRGWEDFSDIRVTMSDDESQVIVSAVDKDSQTVQASLDATDKALVQLYGRDGDTLLMRIVAGAAELNLQ